MLFEIAYYLCFDSVLTWDLGCINCRQIDIAHCDNMYSRFYVHQRCYCQVDCQFYVIGLFDSAVFMRVVIHLYHNQNRRRKILMHLYFTDLLHHRLMMADGGLSEI